MVMQVFKYSIKKTVFKNKILKKKTFGLIELSFGITHLLSAVEQKKLVSIFKEKLNVPLKSVFADLQWFNFSPGWSRVHVYSRIHVNQSAVQTRAVS